MSEYIDFTAALENIIVKYNIDEGYPDFRKYLHAKDALEALFCGYTPNDRLAVIAAYSIDAEILQPYVRKNGLQTINMIVGAPSGGANYSELKQIDGQTVIVVSLIGYREISHQLALRGIKHFCLYDYFIEQGLIFSREFYDYRMAFGMNFTNFDCPGEPGSRCTYIELYYNKKKYREAESPFLQTHYLKRAIFDCLNMRDFLYAFKYMEEYIARFPDHADDLSVARREIEVLMDDIRTRLQNKKEKAIVICWIDALAHDNAEKMPFLKSLDKKTLVFDNAYTVMSSTNPTLQTLFRGIIPGEDGNYSWKTITTENSPTIRTLREYGDDFCYCGFERKFETQHLSRVMIHYNDAASTVFWVALEEILNSKGNICVLAHEFLPTHSPHLSPINEGDSIVYSNKQREESILYVDEQLAFYLNLLPERTTKIILSDHGNRAASVLQTGFHTVFKVQQQELAARRHGEIFSLCRFNELIEYLFDPETCPIERIFQDYAVIQNYDLYSKEGIRRYLRQLLNKTTDASQYNLLAYQGVVCEDAYYVRYRNGMERWWLNGKNKTPLSAERLAELRALTRDDFPDLDSDEMFKHARYVRQMFDNYFRRTGDFEQKKRGALQDMFREKCVGRRVAIRPGGLAALWLIYTIGPELASCVQFFIDTDPNCLCSSLLGYSAVLPGDPAIDLVDLVVVPSRFLNRAEFGDYKPTVLFIYDWLEERGIHCDSEFWRYDIVHDDVPVELFM